ncbi:hypothetical protein L1D14_23080 [Vibrio tubiashii]|uniref:hypothetical protein n=1 Tax=Vibrio tubiashii TaxID=29498 RepID=UPI001EFC5F96|nr:hypothetical protein [Vibrio tubiashii]MCG9579089.1 hypothetical protein [Vibrio tubiashii]
MTKSVIELLLKLVEVTPDIISMYSKKKAEHMLVNFTELFFILSDLVDTGDKLLKTLNEVAIKKETPTRERLSLVQSIIEIQDQRTKRVCELLGDPALELVYPDNYFSLIRLATNKQYGLREMSLDFSRFQLQLKTEEEYPSRDEYLSSMFRFYIGTIAYQQQQEGLTSVQVLKDNLTKIKEEKERYWETLTKLMNVEQKLLIPSQARARADRYSTRH